MFSLFKSSTPTPIGTNPINCAYYGNCPDNSAGQVYVGSDGGYKATTIKPSNLAAVGTGMDVKIPDPKNDTLMVFLPGIALAVAVAFVLFVVLGGVFKKA